jgi:hypothetical protein
MNHTPLERLGSLVVIPPPADKSAGDSRKDPESPAKTQPTPAMVPGGPLILGSCHAMRGCQTPSTQPNIKRYLEGRTLGVE